MSNPTSRLDTIMATSLDGVVATDEHGIVIGWNRNAQTIFGHTTLEALQQPLAELIIPTDARLAHNHGMNRYLTTGLVHILGKRINVTVSTANGTVRTVHHQVMVDSVPHLNDQHEQMKNGDRD